MSVTEEIVGPKLKIGSYMDPVLDGTRLDNVVTKYFNAIWQYVVDIHRANGPLDILMNGPTWAELRATVNGDNFNYAALAALSAAITALNAYLDMPQGAAFPPNFPLSFAWMSLLTVKEKKAITKSTWRTRNFHALMPGWLAMLSLIIILAGVEIYAVMVGKFRKVEAQVYPDSKLQIPYNVLKPETFLAQHYRANFPLEGIYLTIQLDMLVDHLYNAWDKYEFIIPEESVKIGGFLFGQFKNFVLDNEGHIRYDYPVDFIFTGAAYDDNIFGDDFVVIEAALDLIKDLCENLYNVAETLEYGDKFYSNSFADFKAMLTPVKLDTALLTQFGTLPVPWPHIYFGLHHDDVQGREEFILRAWDENANPGIDISDDSGTQTANFFIRILEGKLLEPGVLDEDHPIQYIYALIPYGYDEKAWRKGLVFGWMWLTQFMEGMDLNHTVEFGDLDDLLSHFTYTEYIDTNNTLKQVQAVDDDVEIAEDNLIGMFGFGDHIPFNDQFKLRLINSLAYADLVEAHLGHEIAGDDAIVLAGKFEGDYFENMQRILGTIKNQQSEFDWQHTRDLVLTIINPRIAPPQKNGKEDTKDVVTNSPVDPHKPTDDERPKDDVTKTGKGDPTQPTSTPSGPPKEKAISPEIPKDITKETAASSVKKPDSADISKAPLEEIVDTHVQTE